MASNGEGGEQNVMYAEVIITYYNRETIRYGKAARQSTYRYKPFFFYSHNFSVRSLSLSPMRSFGERVMVMAEKKKNCCLAICPEKCLWVVCCKQKSVDYSVYPFLFRGNKRTSGINELPSSVDLKRAGFLFSSLSEVKTVNWWVVCLSAMFDDDGEEEEIIM